jgi:hypothetical protein
MPRLIFFCILLALASGAASATDRIDGLRTFLVEPPTQECLGFRWYIHGDDNGNATATVQYRKRGETVWHEALPLLRGNREVANWDREPYAAENLFAGSIFSLSPGTPYEVRCSLSDPDGGARADTTVVVLTRSVPVAPKPLRTMHLYPGAGGGAGAYTRFTDLEKVLKPGDLVLVHGGVHHLAPVGFRAPVNASEREPIVFRGAGDGEAILDGDGLDTILDLTDTDHLFFENLTIRNGGVAVRAPGASRLVVRNCTISDVNMGFYSNSELSADWYIANNTITGRYATWYPQRKVNPSYSGFKIYGHGHVITHNRVSRFWDCIGMADFGKPARSDLLACAAIDISWNDISEALDDGVETDYGSHNIRVFGNRIRNVNAALSASPAYGGPVYFIRNEVLNAAEATLDLNDWSAGIVALHNTLLCAGPGFSAYSRWQNGFLRNNLFLGGSGYAMDTGSPHPRTSLDYDGFNQPDSTRFIRWFDGVSVQEYPTLEDFCASTGQECHGVRVDFDSFVRASRPAVGKSVGPGDFDLSLRAVSPAVDAGIPLPNINGGFTGKAPDLGAREREKPAPKYGPE